MQALAHAAVSSHKLKGKFQSGKGKNKGIISLAIGIGGAAVSAGNAIAKGLEKADVLVSNYNEVAITALDTNAGPNGASFGDILRQGLMGVSIRYPVAIPSILTFGSISDVIKLGLQVYPLVLDILNISPTGAAEAGGGPTVFGVNPANLLGYGFVDDTGAVQDPGVTVFSVGEDLSQGTDGSDLIIAYKTKNVEGGKGDDWLVSYQALTIDGGEGNDVVIGLNNIFGDDTPTITAGGLGRDWIINATRRGILWGDIANSLSDPSTDHRYYYDATTGARVDIADSAENADNFWWAPNTIIMDPQRHDILTFFNFPLVGGADDGGAGFNLTLFGKVGTVVGLVQIFTKPIDTIYIDEFLPFITYKFDKQADGSYDLLVGNVLTAFLDAVEYLIGSNATSGLSAALKKYFGAQRIKDFIPVKDKGVFAYTYRGTDTKLLADEGRAGKLGMVFKKANPIAAILAQLPETAITLAIAQGGPMVDQALTLAAAAQRLAKLVKWFTGGDPLVIDLGGHGLVTTAVDQSTVHFDLNDDYFAERTGWLTGDAGFLVYDRNGNGVIDDASEMFGTFTGSGFADLARYDSNNDGVIDALDDIFARLQVWIDANGDGVTQAGELQSLDDLGIASLNLTRTPLDVTTPQGTQLLAGGAFTWADGHTGRMFDATFQTSAVDTRYHGQTGRAAWQGAATLNSKEFGWGPSGSCLRKVA